MKYKTASSTPSALIILFAWSSKNPPTGIAPCFSTDAASKMFCAIYPVSINTKR